MADSDIKALLTAYDEAFQRQFGARAPIIAGKDGHLAKDLLQRYPLEKLIGWVERFCRSQHAFIKQSGYSFGVFHGQVGKIITAKPVPKPYVPTEAEIAFARRVAETQATQPPVEAPPRPSQPKYLTDDQRAELLKQLRATKEKLFGRAL